MALGGRREYPKFLLVRVIAAIRGALARAGTALAASGRLDRAEDVFFLDLAVGAQVMGRLQPWTVVVANLLAAGGMALYQWRRHPSALKNVERLWQDEEKS